MTYCKECFIKQQKINELEAEIASLKDKVRYVCLSMCGCGFSTSTLAVSFLFFLQIMLYTVCYSDCSKMAVWAEKVMGSLRGLVIMYGVSNYETIYV